MMTDIWFLRRVVSREFRSAFLALFPALKESRSLRVLTTYLVWQTPLEDGSILVPLDMLKACVGVKGNGRFNGGNLLDEFSERVAYLETIEYANTRTGELHDYRFTDGKARAVRVHWPVEAEELIAIERDRPLNERMQVHFVDGTAFTRNTRAKVRSEQQKAAQVGAAAKCAEAQEVLDYLNRRAPHAFNKLLELLSAVEAQIRAELEGRSLQSQLDTLLTIAEQPQPFYKAVAGTVRLYETARGLTYLKSEYRHRLTKDWTEYDLTASQLSAAAYLWGVESLKAIFESGQSVWSVLLSELGANASLKPAIKQAAYALCYGAGDATIIEVIIEKGGTEELARRFLELLEVKELLEARERQLKEIIRKRRAREPIVSEVGEDIKDGNPIQVLARLMQAIEFRIIYPALKIAMEHDALVLMQHDGFSVVYRDQAKAERIERQMQAAVEQEAARFGLRTSLAKKAA
jgi:hypothetical protein